jgi:hypothetical protein
VNIMVCFIEITMAFLRTVGEARAKLTKENSTFDKSIF